MGSSRQIGVSVSPLTKQLGDHFGVADGKGLLVSTVRENSPAAKAGLRAGDVIVEVNGKPVSADLDLINALSEKSEGDISLTVVRDRQRRTMSVTPEARTNAAPMMEGFNIDLPDIPKVLNVRPAMPRAPDAPVFRIYQ
jgi:serine protease Do